MKALEECALTATTNSGGCLGVMYKILALSSVSLGLVACGGGSNGSGATSGNNPSVPSEMVHAGKKVTGINDSLDWFVHHDDLPKDGQYGLSVKLPAQGFRPDVRIDYPIGLQQYLGLTDQQYENFQSNFKKIAEYAYMSWTRHLNYDPGIQRIGFDYLEPNDRGTIYGYHDGNVDVVNINAYWLKQNITEWIIFGSSYADPVQALFALLTHEAAHQFGYANANGSTDGCGGSTVPCHAPDGSGSVTSYDEITNYHVTREDISHIPNATWNDSSFDRVAISKSSDANSIYSYGVWIDQIFDVNGRGDSRGVGTLEIVDNIVGTGFVRGRPSENVKLNASANYSGTDNFIGVDLGSNYLGATLRADANLRYTFSDQNLNLRVNDFEAHYSKDRNPATWHDHNFTDWGDFSYDMGCTANGCKNVSAEAKWYSNNIGDPAGYVGGVVNDRTNAYAGSFVAEKE